MSRSSPACSALPRPSSPAPGRAGARRGGPARRRRGARLDVGAAVALARRGRGARKRPPTGWDGLTPTERQVVLLVAEGLSNPEIAGRLFVSRATVKTHLAHAFAKLGVTSRAQLAVVAARRS